MTYVYFTVKKIPTIDWATLILTIVHLMNKFDFYCDFSVFKTILSNGFLILHCLQLPPSSQLSSHLLILCLFPVPTHFFHLRPDQPSGIFPLSVFLTVFIISPIFRQASPLSSRHWLSFCGFHWCALSTEQVLKHFRFVSSILQLVGHDANYKFVVLLLFRLVLLLLSFSVILLPSHGFKYSRGKKYALSASTRVEINNNIVSFSLRKIV